MLKVNSTENLYNELVKLINKDDCLNKEVIKWNGWEFTSGSSKLIDEQPRGKQTWQTVFYNEQIQQSILIKYIDRYIKTKDQLILKSIESIETY